MAGTPTLAPFPPVYAANFGWVASSWSSLQGNPSAAACQRFGSRSKGKAKRTGIPSLDGIVFIRKPIMRRTLNLSLVFCLTCFLCPVVRQTIAAAPLAEKYLLDGKLADGEKALEARLKQVPQDDQARFGLGVLQFMQTFEHLGGGLHKYGLRTEKAFLRPPPQVKEFLPQNPKPEVLTYAAARQLVQTFVDDLAQVEATLAEVKDPAVKLPLHVGLIKIDPFGQGKPISAAFLFERIEGLPVTSQQAEEFVIAFDRGDVSWLRGYCHFLAALGELCLSVDGQHAF